MAAPEFLTHKIGPWPLWGWGAIGAAGVGAGLLLRRTSLFGGGGGGDTPAADATADGADLPVGSGTDGRTVALPGLIVDPNYVPPEPNASTNLDWSRRAVSWLITQNVDPILADAAIGNYLQGVKLTVPQSQALSLALRHFGQPPEGAPPVQATPVPAQPIPVPVKPKPKPAPHPPAPKPKPKPAPPKFVIHDRPFPGVVRYGQIGPPVGAWQQALAERGYHLKVDGVFGPATLNVVRDFQAKHHLHVDGIAGQSTWHAVLFVR